MGVAPLTFWWIHIYPGLLDQFQPNPVNNIILTVLGYIVKTSHIGQFKIPYDYFTFQYANIPLVMIPPYLF